MFVLMISRGYPSKEHPQWGCFEKDQAEALAAYGHKVVVISVDSRLAKHRGGLGLHTFENNNVTYYSYVMLPLKIISKIVGSHLYWQYIKWPIYERLFKKVLKKYGKPEVMYSHFYFNTLAAVPIKKKYGIPLVMIEHLARFNNDYLPPQTDKWACYAFNNADAVVAVSYTLANNLVKRYGIKCSVIHNMYGKEFYPCNNADNRCNSNDPIVFVSAASLVFRKGFDVLIKAFALSELPKGSWILNIIGWGEEKVNLVKLITDNHLQDSIKFLGKMGKEEIAEELRKSDVFVLPSRNENFSVSVLEALATGLPVLATDCGGIRECIDDSNGIIVPVNDVIAMSNAIVQMKNNLNKFDSFEIVNSCKRKFSPEAIAEQLTQLFVNISHNS